MRYIFLISLICCLQIAHSQTYLSEDFSDGIPKAFTLINADGGEMHQRVYKNLGNDVEMAWTACQLSNGYGRVAMSPTHTSDQNLASENWMILPPVLVQDAEAVLRWEARSLHQHLTESFRVVARAVGQDKWNNLYTCDRENYKFTTHAVKLTAYTGQRIEIGFVATSAQGFILAIDNIFVGVPADHHLIFDSHANHYIACTDTYTLSGTLSYFGNQSPWTCAKLTGINGVQTIDLPLLKCGESVDIEFTVNPRLGETYDYTVALVDSEGNETKVYSDFISCSYFDRMHIIDRCSGTWCPNCPVMQLTTSRLSDLYGEQFLVIEAHVNDNMTCKEYWNSYLSEYVFSIPQLIPDHQPEKQAYSVKDSDNFAKNMESVTLATISAEATLSHDGEVTVNTDVQFALDTDNSADTYRVALMLICDIHDSANGNYLQQLSSWSYKDDEYYYQPDYLLPEMMYYDNVIINGSVAYNGIPMSLPASIEANTHYKYSFSLPYVDRIDRSNLRAVAMVIDNTTGKVLNACVTEAAINNAIIDIESDTTNDGIYYDLCGRRIVSPQKGIYISGNKKILRNN